MKIIKKYGERFIIFSVMILIVLITCVRMYYGQEVFDKINIGTNSDIDIKVDDSTKLEMYYEASEMQLTGFGFRYTCVDEKKGQESFKVKIINKTNDKELFDDILLLKDQVYDYQIEDYKVIIPFESSVQESDILKVEITCNNVGEGVYLKASTVSNEQATLMLGDKLQEYVLVSNFYYKSVDLNYAEIIIQGIEVSLIVIFLYFLRKNKNFISKLDKKVKKERTVSFLEIKQRLLNRQVIIKLLILSLILACVFEYAYYAGIKNKANTLYEVFNIYDNENSNYTKIKNGETYSSEYTATENFFCGIGFVLENSLEDCDKLNIQIYDKNDGNEILNENVTKEDFIQVNDKHFQYVFSSNINNSKGKEYKISIKYNGVNSDIKLVLTDVNGDMSYVSAIYRNNTYLENLFIYLCVIISVCTLVIFILINYGVSYEKIVLVSIVSLGIIYGLVFTPYSVPDESSHIDTAYRLSNKILRIEETGIEEAIYKRECDVYTDIASKRMLSDQQYLWLYEKGLEYNVENKLKVAFAADNTNNTNEIFYLPAALGMTVGRILRLGFFGTILTARLFNLCISTIILYFALKKTPIGKEIFIVLSLLPITIQELASCSYDALVISFSFLFVSYCMFGIYSKKDMSKKDIIVILFCSVMLVLCKGCAYAPLLILVVVLAVKRKLLNAKCVPLLLCGVILVMLAATSMYAIEIFDMFGRTQENAYTAQMARELYSFEYLIKNPKRTIRLIENTIYQKTEFYIETMIGGLMGSLQVSTSRTLQMIYVVLMFISTIGVEGKEKVIKFKDRILYSGIALMVVGLVLLSMLINWTTFGSIAIEGVQGRYFLPAMPLIFLCIKNTMIKFEKESYSGIVKIAYILGIGTILSVIINLLGV